MFTSVDFVLLSIDFDRSNIFATSGDMYQCDLGVFPTEPTGL